MTIEQINKIEDLIKQRDAISRKIKKMQDIYAVDFYISCQEDDPIRFMEFNSTNFDSALSTGVVRAAREAVQDYLKGKYEEITAQLKELGLEE